MACPKEPVSPAEASGVADTADPSDPSEPSNSSDTVDYTVPTQFATRTLTPIPETEHGSKGLITRFHPDFDLIVTVQAPGGTPVIYRVCASALSVASPVWRNMLYMDAKRSADSEDVKDQDLLQTMELNGDQEAISLLFRIIHYDYYHVPKEPTLDQLFELCKSACEYQCAHILNPWAGRWTARLADFVEKPDCFSECHKALHIAWTLGDMKLYRDAIDALIVSAKINPNGKIVNTDGHALEDMLISRDLLEIILKARASTVEGILEAVKKPIDILSSGERSKRSPYCKVGRDTQACEVMMLGSIIPALTRVRLFPVPEPEKFTGSIDTLKYTLDGIKTIPYVGKEWLPHMSHESCNLGFGKSVMACLTRMMVPLSVGIMSWMSEQAMKCGIEATTELEEWRQRPEVSISEHPLSENLGKSDSVHGLDNLSMEDPHKPGSENFQEVKVEDEA
ncbi:hypothetical protein F4802DRAFT_416373 [Xylaria palmicola]|nr:hypothetical protein F4802DRAFT_416373 [Xylaria palmicola]